MTNFNLKALVAALIAACANPVNASDAKGLVEDTYDNTQHVTALEAPRADLPTLPTEDYLMPPQLVDWFETVDPKAILKAPSPDKVPSFVKAFNYAIRRTVRGDFFPVPQINGHAFGMSLPFPSDSDMHRVISHRLSKKLIKDCGLNILDLGVGHAFWGIQFFMNNANITWHGMEINPTLVDLFNAHTKPMLRSVDAEKAKRFMMMQGDVDDGFLVVSMSFDEFYEENFNRLLIGVQIGIDLALQSDKYTRTLESLKQAFKENKILQKFDQNLIEIGISKILENRLFPTKARITIGESRISPLPKDSKDAPGKVFGGGSVVAPYSFNLAQAIHCLEHTGLFKVQSYLIADDFGKAISRAEATRRREEEGKDATILLIASRVAKTPDTPAEAGGGGSAGASGAVCAGASGDVCAPRVEADAPAGAGGGGSAGAP